MADGHDFERRLREALHREADQLPLRPDAMTVRDRLAGRSRLPGWLLPVLAPVAAAGLVGLILLNAFPGATGDRREEEASAPAPAQGDHASAEPTARPTPTATPHPVFGRRRATASASGWFYLVGGQSGTSALSSVSAFDGLTWSSLPDLPEGRAGAGAAALPDGRLFIFGGEIDHEPTASTLVLEPGADAWTVADPMPHPQADMAVVELNGRAYLVGGSTIGHASDVLVFDPDGGGWSVVQTMPFELAGVAAAALGNAIYVLGTPAATLDGIAPGPAPLAVMLRYDQSTDAWTELAPAPLSGQPLSAVTAGGRIWAIGHPDSMPTDRPPPSAGDVFQGPDRLGVAFYEPDLDAWTLTDEQLPPGSSTQIVIPSDRQLIVIGASGGGITTTIVTVDAP